MHIFLLKMSKESKWMHFVKLPSHVFFKGVLALPLWVGPSENHMDLLFVFFPISY